MMHRVIEDTLVQAQSDEVQTDIVEDFDILKVNIVVLLTTVFIAGDTTTEDRTIYVGRLVPKKGLEYFIDAMAEMDVLLMVVGDGSKNGRIVSLTDELEADVSLVGEVALSNVDEYSDQQESSSFCQWLVKRCRTPSYRQCREAASGRN